MVGKKPEVELWAPLRSNEWRCKCPSPIRSGTVQRCERCKAEQPNVETHSRHVVTVDDALRALDRYDSEIDRHGHRLTAMLAVLLADRERNV